MRLLPPSLLDGFTAIVGGQVGMAAGLVQFRQRPEQAAALIAPGIRLSPAGDYLMWAISAFPGCFARFGARCAGKVGGRGQCDSQGREPVGEDQGPGYGC